MRLDQEKKYNLLTKNYGQKVWSLSPVVKEKWENRLNWNYFYDKGTILDLSLFITLFGDIQIDKAIQENIEPLTFEEFTKEFIKANEIEFKKIYEKSYLYQLNKLKEGK